MLIFYVVNYKSHDSNNAIVGFLLKNLFILKNTYIIMRTIYVGSIDIFIKNGDYKNDRCIKYM